jgi:hypothetical protein
MSLVLHAASVPLKQMTHLPFTITVQPNTILPTEVAIGYTVHAMYKITNNNESYGLWVQQHVYFSTQ